MNINVGQLIKKARLEKGYTQEELAELVGVKKSAVAKWETGRVSEIKRSNLKKISEALSIDAPMLLGEEPDVMVRKPTHPQIGELSEDELDIIEDLRRLAKADQDTVRRMIKSFSGSVEK